MEDTLQPTIDLILNMSMFIWLGAVCPWSAFTDSSIVPLPRLILLVILILALRRLPVILSLRPWVRHIHTTRDAFFMGFFGPIGVSAIFYYCLCIEYLATFQGGEAMAGLAASMRVVVWFLIMTSVVSLILPYVGLRTDEIAGARIIYTVGDAGSLVVRLIPTT